MAKIRTQIQLDPQDYQRIRKFAADRGLSLSGAIRLLIRERFLEGSPAEDKLQAFFAAAGAWCDPTGVPDVARKHDDYLYGSM